MGLAGLNFPASYEKDAPRRIGMPQIIFDGFNLALEEGTGVATYARMLTKVAHDLGHRVGIIYGSPQAPSRNPVLREIGFFDEKRAT